MKLYLGLAGPLLLFVYLPLVLIGLFYAWRKCQSTKARATALPIYLALAYVIPLGDVTVHSWNMAKVCPKAGLHVYRTVEAEGFMPADESYVKRFGYQFSESSVGSRTGLVTRWERIDGDVVRLDKVNPKSQWELISGTPLPEMSLGVNQTHDVVRNTNSGEVIAERFYYSAWRGWIDVKIGSLIDNPVGGCGGGAVATIAKIDKILIPVGAGK